MPSSRSKASTTNTTTTKAKATAAWPPEADYKLVQARAAGATWVQISQRLFPHKTETACRKRHQRIADKQRAEDLSGPRLQDLALAYMDVRQEMWTQLGKRLNEDWQSVEKSCMEQGIMNLRSAANSARRSGQPSPSSTELSGDTQYCYDQRPRVSGPTIASMLAPPYPELLRCSL